jgi:hypothetical protein
MNDETIGHDPIVVSPFDTVQTSRQIKCHLLCTECEQRFSARGEQLVIKDCCRGPADFPLREKLRLEQPRNVDSDAIWFSASDLISVEVEKYYYFAASVFWRGSAGKWRAPGAHEWSGALGSKYEESFRQYLFSEKPFPPQALLVVFVANEDNPLTFTTVTSCAKKQGYHIHKFHVPGVEFRMFLGNKVDQRILAPFRAWSTKAIFVLRDSRTCPGFAELVKMVQSSQPRGKIAISRGS